MLDETDDRIGATYRLSAADVEAGLIHFRNTNAGQILYHYLRWFGMPAAMIFGILIPVGSGESARSPQEIALNVLPWVIGWVIAYPFLRSLGNQRALQRVLKQLPDDYLGEHRVAISLDGIVVNSAASEVAFSWSALEKVDVTASHVFVFQKKQICLIFPRAGFKNSDDFDAIVNFTQKRLELRK